MVQCKEVARLRLLLHLLLFLLPPLDTLLFLSYFSITHSSSLSFLSSLAKRFKDKQEKFCSLYIHYTHKVNIALNGLCAHIYQVVLLLVACPLLGACSSQPNKLLQEASLSFNYCLKIQLHSNQVNTLFGQQCQAKCIFFSLSFCLLCLA